MNDNKWTSSAAYDLSAYDAIPQGAHYQAPRKLVVRTTVSPKARTKPVCVALCVLCILALLCTIIVNNAASVEMGNKIQSATTQLNSLTDEYDKLSARLASSANASDIQAYASGNLGLCAAERYQITYIRIAEADTVQRNASAMGTGVRDILGQSLTGAVSFLKLK